MGLSASQLKAVAALGATMVAVGIAAPEIARHEGWVETGYFDSIGVKTRCLGSTRGNIIIGKRYSAEECMDLFAQDLVKHGLEIAPCLPAELPPDARAAFISIGFNIGSAGFCRSSMSRLALAGDLPGACAAISLYRYAGGRDCAIRANNCYGIIERRNAERARCESGIWDGANQPLPPPPPAAAPRRDEPVY